LKRWRAEGPTERNRQMAQFILSHGSVITRWSHALTEQGSLLIDLALEWSDFSMWQAVLERASDGYTPQLNVDLLIRGWGVFTFDRTKNMSVHSTLTLSPRSHSPPFNAPCRIGKVIRSQPNTKAAVEFISAFRAHAPTQDPNVKAWWNQQTTAVFSSIKQPPTDNDVQMFVGIAKSEGLLFFSKTCVLSDGRNDPLT